MTSPDESKGGRSRDEVLAGEYVLGALSAEQRRKVEERIERDVGFAAIVNRWAQNVSEFGGEFGGDPIHRGLLSALDDVQGTEEAGGSIARLWRSLALWRFLAFASVIVAAGVGFLKSGVPPSNASRDGLLVAELSGGNSSVGLALAYDDGTGRMQLGPVASDKSNGKALEVWLLRGSQPVRSLGVLPQNGEGTIEIPTDMRRAVSNGSIVAVSLEPLGGSPSGKPTGPFVAQGVTHRP